VKAISFCEKLQSKLISITNEQEFNCLKKMNTTHGIANIIFKNEILLLFISQLDAASELNTLGKAIGFWISGRLSENKTKEWIWATAGQKFTFTNWAPGMPNNFLNLGENCVGFNLLDKMSKNIFTAPSMMWDDFPCTNLMFPICEV
jgi:hypothetical protein